MGIIGYDTVGAFSNDLDNSYWQTLDPVNTYTAGANEVITKVSVYSDGETDATAEVAVYDITGGLANASLVCNFTVSHCSGLTGWCDRDLTPAEYVALTEGNEYALAYKINTAAVWSGQGGLFIDQVARRSDLDGTDNFPDPWGGTDTSDDVAASAYALTEVIPQHGTIVSVEYNREV